LAVVDVGDDAEVADVFHGVINSMEQNSSANRPSSTALNLTPLQAQKLALRAQTVCAAGAPFR
ncbi:MAG TPA: hypothetical protein PKH25_10605, partial [Syntrophales bacterium]|nr:hypothetical protein [Syntrophales bacterium]